MFLAVSGFLTLFSIASAKAETLCAFQGPETSQDYLRLSNLSVIGNSSLKTGDTVTVKFDLQNYGQYELTLGQRGFFMASRDSGGLDTSFGFTRASTKVKTGETVTVEVSRILDKSGTWIIWPSYHILSGKEYKLGPDNWHSCSLNVAAVSSDSDKDGLNDSNDNCPSVYNPDQKNGDGDSFGDACDDSDQDGATDDKDNCIFMQNQGQSDADADGIGDACDNCDDRDSDQDKIKNCIDKCQDKPETYNNYQDDDGCPDAVPVADQPKAPEPPKQEPGQKQEEPSQPQQPEAETPKALPGKKPGTLIITLPSAAGARTETINPPTRERVTEGPIIPGAFEDGDGDGVVNMFDECPETPEGKYVFENGCRCKDSDGGKNKWMRGTISYYKDDGTIQNTEESCRADNRTIREHYCTANAERLDIMSRVSIEEISCDGGCEDGRCVIEAAPLGISFETIVPLGACSAGTATCADGIQNQDETGVDCGGKCAPCNTVCETPVKYAPPDTPCVSHFFGGGTYISESGRRTTGVLNASDESRSDQHRIELEWTDGGGECNCQFYEICDPDLDFVIEEAQQCCSATSLEQVEGMPDPNLCKDALRSARGNCKRCTGVYIIKGLGTYARWMQGYARTRAMDYYVCGAWAEAAPTERLINEHKTGICRDYSGALITLLRKAGYGQREVGNTCDGAHCYNIVKLPGDAKWHVVDTTGNSHDMRLGGLPSGYPYCFALDETKWCFNNTKTFDVDAYQESRRLGNPFAFSTCLGSPGFIGEYMGRSFDFDREYSVQCGPGIACYRDNYMLPEWAPSISQIVGCE